MRCRRDIPQSNHTGLKGFTAATKFFRDIEVADLLKLGHKLFYVLDSRQASLLTSLAVPLEASVRLPTTPFQ